jgi:hypothetical protein
MGRSRLAWRSQMGRVLVGWSLVGRLWHRSLLGVDPRWLGLELLLSASQDGIGVSSIPMTKCPTPHLS